jgi:glycosyltransferase involved in cell wall biosynthesis/GT2 family glycosyltransferase
MQIGRGIAAAASRLPFLASVVTRVQKAVRRRRLALKADSRLRPHLPGDWTASPYEYALWIAASEPDPSELIRQRSDATRLGDRPLISVILPVYNVPLPFLIRAIDSLVAQTYPGWEACIACAAAADGPVVPFLRERMRTEPRLRVKFLDSNGGIAANSNEALSLAQGVFVALLDHDDELAPFALSRMVEAITATPDADFFYSDKDSIDAGSTVRQNALLKPCWSPETMFSVNYLTHFNVMRRSLVDEVGGFRSETDGAQDWDIFLRVCERSRAIVRVPGVHYHWRIHPASTSTGLASKPYALAGQLRTLCDHIARLGLPAEVVPNDDSGFRVCWKLRQNMRVHIVVDATDGHEEHLPELLRKIAAAADTAGMQTVVSVIAGTASSIAPAAQLRVFSCGPDDQARLVNEAVAGQRATTDALVFVSGRVASFDDAWLSELVGWVTGHPEIGFSSGLILDAVGDVVEAGLVVDCFEQGSPLFRGSPLRHCGWLGGPLWYRNCTASSPWLVAVNPDSYEAAGGFDEQLPWQHAFVGLCRAIHRSGKRGVVDPHARATLAAGDLPPVPPFHDSVRGDPYFHPAFSSVVPLKFDAGTQAECTRIPSPKRRLRLPRLRLRRRSAPHKPNGYAADAMILAQIANCTLEDLDTPQQHPERVGRGPGAGWCNWYLPTFDNAFYGGVMTILRCAEFLHRRHGIRPRFLICGIDDTGLTRQKICQAFPALSTAPVLALDGPAAIAAIPPADYSIATLWTTAYVLLNVANTGLKFYFIQDFEPLFYPAGSTYAQAELTYRFGFHGIANTRTLKAIYEQDYEGSAVHFTPQIDPTVFHGSLERPAAGPKRLFFYARPNHPRNGFELAAAALRRLKDAVGDRVDILCAGAPWDPREHGLDGIVTNLGLLRYAETAELYRSCHIGFVMMMTRHPSYLPFEFMACGGLIVSNDNPANDWLLKSGYNCLLAPASASAIAQRLAYAIDRYDELHEIRRNGQELIACHHSDWDHTFSGVFAFMAGLSARQHRRAA